MKSDQIAEMLEKFEEIRYEQEGIECWSARELHEVLNYSDWRNFLKV
jgi:DNA-damage-inducible protein D